MANRKITWSKSALKQFEAAINYIAEDSIQNAEKVRKEILEKIERLIAHPEIYSPHAGASMQHSFCELAYLCPCFSFSPKLCV